MSTASSISMQRLQRADQTLGAVACVALQPWRLARKLFARPREAERVLVIKFWGIGSLQLLTPAIASLRTRHPGAEIVFLTLAQNRATADALGVFDRVLSLDVARAGWLTLAQRIGGLLRRLRRERFDEVYDFEFFTRFSALVSLATGAPRSHGFAAPNVWRGGFHTDVAPFNRYWHVARNFRVLAGGENGRNVTANDLAPHRYDARDVERVDALLEAHGIPREDAFAVLNPNAGELSLERRWPRENFTLLADRLAREEGVAVVFIGSAAERNHTEFARGAAASSRVLNLAGELSTQELVALLARAAVVVTNDSGPMHLAAAVGAPTLGLFGPETPVMYGPIGLRARALYRPPPCSPCINVHHNKLSSCIYGHPQCLVAISVDEVLAHARALLRGEDFELVPVPPPAPHPPHVPPDGADAARDGERARNDG
ncbi:MAG: glycosyltransferase family 9 protein [Planctomycetes bacterium]|nr:glycosyltransferase family 9 protein [Planctomycetota bacterium]